MRIILELNISDLSCRLVQVSYFGEQSCFFFFLIYFVIEPTVCLVQYVPPVILLLSLWALLHHSVIIIVPLQIWIIVYLETDDCLICSKHITWDRVTQSEQWWRGLDDWDSIPYRAENFLLSTMSRLDWGIYPTSCLTGKESFSRYKVVRAWSQ